MQTKSGELFSTLLNVSVSEGSWLTVTVKLPEAVPCYGYSDMAAIQEHIEKRIALEKKPCAAYSKVLEQINAERQYLAELYTKLFETYERAVDITPKTRMSPKDKAMSDMLQQMPDKMLRDFTALQLGDSASDFILPTERQQLIDAYIAIGKNSVSAE